MNHKDQQLQLALAKMLPKELVEKDNEVLGWHIAWRGNAPNSKVRESEWLHVCWLVEQEFVSIKQQDNYRDELCEIFYKHNPQHTQICSASWQQRAEALCKVKGIEI